MKNSTTSDFIREPRRWGVSGSHGANPRIPASQWNRKGEAAWIPRSTESLAKQDTNGGGKETKILVFVQQIR